MTSALAPRVLVVDDSAFVRKVVSEVLTSGGCEVVGIARDGLEALEKIQSYAPDVITLDLMMPGLDGLGVLEELAGARRPPAVVVVSVSGADTEAGITALQRGAVAVVKKPTALATGRLYELESELLQQVRTAAAARPRIALDQTEPPSPLPPPTPRPASRTDLIAVGASTGGPQALTYLLKALPADLPVPIAIVLHIPPGYTGPLAARLDRASPLRVDEASEGLELQPGMAVLARAGLHLKIVREGSSLRAHLDKHPALARHRPSVDVLFETAVAACGARTLGVVLTGMGEDGLAGARQVHAAGGRLLTEDASSAVVWGMPRAVWEAELATAQAPLSALPALIVEHI